MQQGNFIHSKTDIAGQIGCWERQVSHEFQSGSGPRLLSGLPFMVMMKKSWLLGMCQGWFSCLMDRLVLSSLFFLAPFTSHDSSDFNHMHVQSGIGVGL